MAVYINESTRVLVQGITGRQGSFHTAQMLSYGTRLVGGVSPGKSGLAVEGVPVYGTVFEAMEKGPAEASILFIPAPFVRDAVFEALDAGIRLLVIITESIPLHDALDIMDYARQKGALVAGPNTFGLVSSGKCKIGIMPNRIYVPGPVGVVSRSGTLSYEVVSNLCEAGLGTSTVVGLGGDRVVGLNFIDVLKEFENDPATEVVVMLGEIGGSAEEVASEFIAEYMTKPVVAYIAGKSAPPGKRMGHAGAIIEGGRGTFDSKIKALRGAGVQVAGLHFEVSALVKKVLGN